MEKILIITYPEEGWQHLSCLLRMEILHSMLSYSTLKKSNLEWRFCSFGAKSWPFVLRGTVN